METIKLIKKFAPIFVFHSRETHFPVNLETAEKQEFKENLCPEDPLYYTIINNGLSEMTVNYVLLFPKTYKGLFGYSSINGDVKFIRMIFDTKKKTLKKIYYGNHLLQEFTLKTDRPRIYVSLETHNFYPMIFSQKNIFGIVTEETQNGLSWETTNTLVYQPKKLKGKRYGDSRMIPTNFYENI
jgi:hypothetical protein